MTDTATGGSEKTTSDERWTSAELARRIASIADDRKAVGTVLLNVQEALQVTDWFVITQGRNRRHLSGIAEHIAKELKPHGIYRLAGTPFNDENWVVIDFGSVVVHVFSTQAREFYDLENLWGDCERIDWKSPDAPDAADVDDDDDDEEEDEDADEAPDADDLEGGEEE